ncbi:putative BSD domain-containing protein [Helianthus annuus]|nr:putative BSD domain-containing protein [Helianthus annuus]KAJ0545615.1 putative BSD domain-containing protein [Helianthus annuus]KAJ0718195.1 putative BSD domain-containing protein [Helianthus annuus]
METFWQKAKSLAEEATKRSQTLTSSPVRIADIVSETAKRSKDIAAEASRKADQLKNAALLSLADQIPSLSITSASSSSESPSESELETFGITEDLRGFVKGLTLSTFQNFPFPDDAASDVATVSNVRQDLSEWQQKHANLVLTTVKEVSKLRYELCPRHMKDGRFWRIYFTLVSTHVSPYERKFVEESKLKQIAQAKDEKSDHTPAAEPESAGANLKSKTSTSEQDLDSFLLGDLDDSDGHPDDGDNDAFDDDDDDFDKADISEMEDEK